jgi:hypothetical protein
MSVRARFHWLVLALAVVAGCQPKTGDKCRTSTDCSSRGDRICDTSQPEGYCTIFNCLGGGCTEKGGGSCVAIDVRIPGCSYDDRRSPARTARSLCLANCEDDTDCRRGDYSSGYDYEYECVTPEDRGAVSLELVQPGQKAKKVCMLKGYVIPAVGDAGEANVCKPVAPDAGPADAGSDAGADGGADASDGGAADAATD